MDSQHNVTRLHSLLCLSIRPLHPDCSNCLCRGDRLTKCQQQSTCALALRMTDRGNVCIKTFAVRGAASRGEITIVDGKEKDVSSRGLAQMLPALGIASVCPSGCARQCLHVKTAFPTLGLQPLCTNFSHKCPCPPAVAPLKLDLLTFLGHRHGSFVFAAISIYGKSVSRDWSSSSGETVT